MNLNDWREFAAKIDTEKGALVITRTPMSTSLVDDAAIDVQALLASEAVEAAQAFYDRDTCVYTYIPPDGDEPYNHGPFPCLDAQGMVYEDMVEFISRVRITRRKDP